jgi:hypothetical protein
VTSPRSQTRSPGLVVGAVAGAVGLALLVVLAVLLPKAEGAESQAVQLPDELPGGFVALDVQRDLPQELGLPDNFAQVQGAQARTTMSDYEDAYGAPVAFRGYADQQLQTVAFVTVFAGDGEAFGPDFGTNESTRVERSGDAVCELSFQQSPTGQGAADEPTTVTCQVAGEGHTVQVATGGVSVEDTVKLADHVAEDVA